MTRIIATDLDHTLTGNDSALNELNEQFRYLRLNNKIKLIYVTGRSFERYKKLQNTQNLLIPDLVATSVGTEIHESNGSLYDTWPIVKDWNRQEILNRLKQFPLIKQPDSEQTRFRISYFLNDVKLYNNIKDNLKNLKVDVIYSQGRYLDIIPQEINKGSAIQYIAKLWQISTDDIITCGDSENDISLLAVGKAIVVNNATLNLKRWAEDTKNSQAYFAKSSFAAGVIEGLKHWNVLS